MQESKTPRQIGYDASAFVHGETDPTGDFGGGAATADAQRKDRVDGAYFVAGGLDRGHDLNQLVSRARLRIAAGKAIERSVARTESLRAGPEQSPPQ